LKKTPPRTLSRHASKKTAAKARKHESGFSFFRSLVAAFVFGCGGVIALDALKDVALNPISEAHASAEPAKDGVLSWAVDTNGDGVADLANPVQGAMRSIDSYGSGAFGSVRDGGKRKHEGVDYVASPGQTAAAPISGTIVRIGYAYKKDTRLKFVEIDNAETGYSARVLYVSPTIAIGQQVAAGDVIGVVQDLSVKYPAGITNHVHVEIRDPSGVTLDSAFILPSAPILQASAEAFGASP
jgi:murein DD-endopeptidase MepM/ murein hydrolase activator NlpD